MERVNSVIVRYLKSNKRLVIPTLGAFIRKDDGQVVFMEFLKKDDGVLAAEVGAAYPLAPQQRTALVDRYLLAFRQGAASPQGFVIARLGTVRTDTGGLMYLDYDPDTQPGPAIPVPVVPAAAAAPAAKPAAPATPATPAVSPAMAAPVPAAPAPKPVPTTPATTPPMANPANAHPLASRVEGVAQPQSTAKSDIPVDGMRYGKPAPQTPDHRKRRADIIMIIAIAAAALAIAVMIFSMMNEQPQHFDLDEQTEVPAVVQPDTVTP
ncbi:MAG: hypothetical protein LBU95_04510 [Rikenellaceae bacterium]|jgi:predicted component of type VI protein secretion system|nr:hypothetical protein [Rikenellaceae bacterium]